MTPRGSAIAGLAEDVGKALLLFAERLRAEDEATASPAPARDATRGRARLGGTQAALLDALRASGTSGMTTAELAEAVGMAPTNAPRALKALLERGLVTASADTPTVWRSVVTEDEPPVDHTIATPAP